MVRSIFVSLVLFLGACGSSSEAPAPSAEVATAPAAAAAPVTEVAPAPAPAAPTVAGLFEGWSASDARIGTEITLAGTFGNAMAGSGHVRSVSVVGSEDDGRTIWCELAPETAPEHVTLMGHYSPITVRGTLVDDHGSPALTAAAIVP